MSLGFRYFQPPRGTTGRGLRNASLPPPPLSLIRSTIRPACTTLVRWFTLSVLSLSSRDPASARSGSAIGQLSRRDRGDRRHRRLTFTGDSGIGVSRGRPSDRREKNSKGKRGDRDGGAEVAKISSASEMGAERIIVRRRFERPSAILTFNEENRRIVSECVIVRDH